MQRLPYLEWLDANSFRGCGEARAKPPVQTTLFCVEGVKKIRNCGVFDVRHTAIKESRPVVLHRFAEQSKVVYVAGVGFAYGVRVPWGWSVAVGESLEGWFPVVFTF